ncbi:HAD-IA family hydrolase [Adhaeribacter radiodurans]|uniref:HAD-IA family hydrolase n=1 Tax=Adhaeribacter radiodurans TaxID=2745197 RepID=A0A7L7L9S9_9BACT|nr:HAD-IA family hydrolase [Adhaeribacter radiodurans]QMU29580.1 HAD-IA family hydrolase [Adhaeribacter radiodurans]
MSDNFSIKALFLDIGGVFLTNGWDRAARKRAAENFNLDYEQLNERHHLTFDTYESGKLSLDEYLDRIVFYEDRPYSRQEFTKFIMDQTGPFPDMIALVTEVKQRYGLKTIAVNNEGREINAYRIQQFGLNKFIDTFVSSCFVHFRKPDHDIFRLALDVAQVAPENSIYIDDRAMFVREASSLGMHCIHHTSFATTRQALANFGLV